MLKLRNGFSHDWCGSVGWALACELKGHWFDSWSGHIPGSRASVQEATNQCFSPSLAPSLPFSLKMTKEKRENKEREKRLLNKDKIQGNVALAGMAQWTECRPANQRVAGSISSQGTCLRCRPGRGLGGAGRGATGNHTLMFLSLFLPPFLSLKINKISKNPTTQKCQENVV